MLDRNIERLEAVAVACRAQGATCRTESLDVSKTDALSALLENTGRETAIDLLIANAGILDGRSADETVERHNIVLVASFASLVPLPDAPAYSTSKAGLLSYGLALSDAGAAEGIEVIVACPGFVAPRWPSAIRDEQEELAEAGSRSALLENETAGQPVVDPCRNAEARRDDDLHGQKAEAGEHRGARQPGTRKASTEPHDPSQIHESRLRFAHDRRVSRLRGMKAVQRVIQPLVGNVVCRSDCDCGTEAKDHRIQSRVGVEAAQLSGEYQGGYDEHMLDAVV